MCFFVVPPPLMHDGTANTGSSGGIVYSGVCRAFCSQQLIQDTQTQCWQKAQSTATPLCTKQMYSEVLTHSANCSMHFSLEPN